MRISGIKNFFNRYIYPRRQNVTPHLSTPPACDTFEKQSYSKVLSGVKNDECKSDFAIKILRENPMNKDVYAELSPTELDALRAQLDFKRVSTAKTLVNASKIIKNIFDKKYGENQYTFVSVGRSLSALANCLEFLGVETRQIPLSECGGAFQNVRKNVNNMVEQVGFEDYKEFLEQTFRPQGDKKYIVCDYASTGNSLRVFKELLNRDEVGLGSQVEDFVGINRKFFSKNSEGLNISDRLSIKIFEQLLFYQQFDSIAEVKSLNFNDLYRINSAIYEPLKPQYPLLNKLMKFCMLDILHTTA